LTGFCPTDYVVATSVEHALNILDNYGDRAKILAGGTTIHELASRGMIPQIEVLIDVEKLGLSYVRDAGEEIRIGATTTITEALASEKFFMERIPFDLGAIAESLNTIHPDQVRNVATIGGEVCSAIPFLDLPPALIALDTSIVARGPLGTRTIRLHEFYQDFFLSVLKPKEIVTEVRIPKPMPHSGSAFRKFARTGNDWAMVNFAASVHLDDSGRMTECRIVAGAIGRTPVRLTKAENTLSGAKPSQEALNRATRAVYSEVQPTTGIGAPGYYKKEIARVLARETLEESIEGAKRG